MCQYILYNILELIYMQCVDEFKILHVKTSYIKFQNRFFNCSEIKKI